MSIFEKSIKQKIKEAKENPVRIFALVYPYLLVVGLGIGLFYVAKFNIISRKTVPPALPDTTAVTQIQVQPAKTIPPVDVMKMKNPSQDLVAKGKTLFSANCSSCHGTDGKGDGPASAGLNPPPRNYTVSTGWINGEKISDIYKTLQEGIPNSAMASYEYLNPEDKFALAAYIRSAFIKNPPQDTDDDLFNLDLNYNLSAGKVVPAQIPIKYAEQFIIQEHNDKYQKIITIIGEINKDNSSDGAAIFNKVVKDKMSALAMLSNSTEWKQSEKKFIDMIINESNQDGFNDNVFNLTGSQWDTFYKYMNKYL